MATRMMKLGLVGSVIIPTYYHHCMPAFQQELKERNLSGKNQQRWTSPKGNAIRVLLPSLLSSASYISSTFFNWMSKVIRDCTGFALLCSVIGLENLSHTLNHQMHNKFLLLIQFGFTLSSHWLLKVFTFPLIGGCDYYSFGFFNTKF